MQQGSFRGSSHSENLDALRAVAVLLVLADHVLETVGHQYGRSFHPIDWQLGRIGVLLFFVHTSFVLMQSMERLHRNSSTPTVSFAIRRIFRIYPLSIVCVLLVFFLEIPPLPFAEHSHLGLANLASNLALTMNLTGSKPMLSPLWSLPVELQMYMVLPLLYATVANRPFGVRTILAWGICVALALLQPHVSARLNVAYFAPCFMAGVMAYTLKGRITEVVSGRLWLPFIGLLICGYLGIEAIVPGVHNGAVQWALCLVVGISIPIFQKGPWHAVNAAGAIVAKYSYGIYLFHCIAIWIGCFQLNELSRSAQWFIASASLGVMCWVGYHFLEKPAMDLGARIAEGVSRAAVVRKV